MSGDSGLQLPSGGLLPNCEATAGRKHQRLNGPSGQPRQSGLLLLPAALACLMLAGMGSLLLKLLLRPKLKRRRGTFRLDAPRVSDRVVPSACSG